MIRPGVQMLDTMKNKLYRRTGGHGEVRGAAREGCRSAGTGGQFNRQCAGRTRHRRQNRRRTDPRARRSGNSARSAPTSSRKCVARGSSNSLSRHGFPARLVLLDCSVPVPQPLDTQPSKTPTRCASRIPAVHGIQFSDEAHRGGFRGRSPSAWGSDPRAGGKSRHHPDSRRKNSRRAARKLVA